MGSTVGVVGLGAMGGRIAARLLDTGHQVHGTNRTRVKARPLLERGLRWQDTPRAVAAAVDVVFSMVTDDTALGAITGGPDGILAGLRPGAVYIDMSSVSPQASVRVAKQVRALGARMLDAPVSGAPPQAEQARLAIMVGGDRAAFRRFVPLLAQLGHPVTHVGGNGHGVLLKLAINIGLAVQTLAFSEGLLLAERGGIDPHVAARIMSTSSIGSPMLAARVPLLLDPAPQAWFDVGLMHKDIRLALGQAQLLHLMLPSAAAADHALSAADELGYGPATSPGCTRSWPGSTRPDAAAQQAVARADRRPAMTDPTATDPTDRPHRTHDRRYTMLLGDLVVLRSGPPQRRRHLSGRAGRRSTAVSGVRPAHRRSHQGCPATRPVPDARRQGFGVRIGGSTG